MVNALVSPGVPWTEALPRGAACSNIDTQTVSENFWRSGGWGGGGGGGSACQPPSPMGGSVGTPTYHFEHTQVGVKFFFTKIAHQLGLSSAKVRPSLFCDTGGGGGVKFWMRQAFFQGRHCFCPTPTLGGGASSQRGRHPLNIKPHATSSSGVE